MLAESSLVSYESVTSGLRWSYVMCWLGNEQE